MEDALKDSDQANSKKPIKLQVYKTMNFTAIMLMKIISHNLSPHKV